MSSGDAFNQITERIKALAGSWPAYTALATFALYVLGYLSLRFQVSALGVISSDFAALDERYLFAGIDFLVYLVPQASSAFLLLLLAALPLGVVLALFALGAKRKGTSLAARFVRWRECLSPRAAFTWAALGVVASVLLVQMVMRQCFAFQSLLLAPALPRSPAWLAALLTSEDGASRALFFIGILLATVACAAWLAWLRPKLREFESGRWLAAIYASVVLLQVLLWPANYALLAVAERYPKVGELNGEKAGDKMLAAGDQAWLVWRSKETLTLFVISAADGQRSLVALPAKDMKFAITGYDRLITKVHARP
ncbi:MAG: hypothetical protein FJY56_02610 [Betaproteobacteria bacterium]|nr:hypothetical protein [Betaproteobacteria bacterium]